MQKKHFVNTFDWFIDWMINHAVCVINRFVPRHGDELELEVDDPLLMEVQADDLWCKAYNMRTGASGIFPAYYAAKVTQEPIKGIKFGLYCLWWFI